MKYFGKRYLYNFLTSHGFEPPKLKNMEYGKYRGDEWLRCGTLDLFCIFGQTINVSVLEYDELTDDQYETERHAFGIFGKEWQKTYERIGKKITVARQLTFDDLVYEGGAQ